MHLTEWCKKSGNQSIINILSVKFTFWYAKRGVKEILGFGAGDQHPIVGNERFQSASAEKSVIAASYGTIISYVEVDLAIKPVYYN